jgi:hypothetical protein
MTHWRAVSVERCAASWSSKTLTLTPAPPSSQNAQYALKPSRFRSSGRSSSRTDRSMASWLAEILG